MQIIEMKNYYISQGHPGSDFNSQAVLEPHKTYHYDFTKSLLITARVWSRCTYKKAVTAPITVVTTFTTHLSPGRIARHYRRVIREGASASSAMRTQAAPKRGVFPCELLQKGKGDSNAAWLSLATGCASPFLHRIASPAFFLALFYS